MTEPNEYAREFLALYAAKKSLYKFVLSAIIERREGWVDGRHIREICDTVQEFLTQSEKHILCLSIPPRHMKSVIISNALPVWWILNHSQDELMLVSYGQSLARDNLRACRQLLDEDVVRRIWGSREDVLNNADALQLAGKANGRPNLVASGVGGPLTGKGCNILVVDDPVKDALQADSATYRQRLIEWFNLVATSRLAPGGKIIIVATRWTYDDLIAYEVGTVPEETVEINHPAIDDDGRALWPERYSVEELLAKRRIMGSRSFEAQYQGRPTPTEGGLIRREWIRTGPPMGADADRVRYWDKAATHDGGDWTVGCLMAQSDGEYCIEDIVRIQGSPKEVQETVRRTAARDGVNVRIMLEQEPGSSGVDVVDLWSRHILRGYPFRGERVTGSKEVRADGMIAAFEAGNLRIVQAQWNRELVDELVCFPLGAHDDQVDACSGAFRALAQRGRDFTVRWV